MLKSAFPAVSLPRDDYVRLMRLARRARIHSHPVAEFLLSEVCRAKITDEAPAEQDSVTLNRRVTYRVDDGAPECRVLVHPEDYTSPERQISVLSPVGAALIGIRAGDRMPFLNTDGALQFVTVVSVDPPPPFATRPRPDYRPSGADDDPSGPRAA